jgi:hypothetical protein
MMSGALLAGFSACGFAGMSTLSQQDLSEVAGQGYILTVGSMPFAAPFAYDVYASKAPAPLVTTGQSLVSTFAPGYATKVGMARTTGVGKVNTGLSLATSSLQAIPIIGGFVPSIMLSTD